MKTLLVLSLMCLVCTRVLGQGTINFNNKVSAAGVDAPISFPAGSPPGGPTGAKIDGSLYPAAMAALYAAPDGASVDQLVMVGSPVGFRSGSAAGYINVGSFGIRTIAGVLPGDFVFAQVRAWDACDPAVDTYEKALSRNGSAIGTSGLLRIRTGDAAVPANLVGLSAFTIGFDVFCPEPPVWALLSAAGSVGLFIRGRYSPPRTSARPKDRKGVQTSG